MSRVRRWRIWARSATCSTRSARRRSSRGPTSPLPTAITPPMSTRTARRSTSRSHSRVQPGHRQALRALRDPRARGDRPRGGGRAGAALEDRRRSLQADLARVRDARREDAVHRRPGRAGNRRLDGPAQDPQGRKPPGGDRRDHVDHRGGRGHAPRQRAVALAALRRHPAAARDRAVPGSELRAGPACAWPTR